MKYKKIAEKAGVILIACCVAVLAFMTVTVKISENADVSGDITVIQAPEQTEAMENDAFKTEEYTAPVIDGTNVALGATVTSNGFNDVYKPVNAVDGARGTYWEGDPSENESIITVELDGEHDIFTVVLALNPAAVWSKRTQNVALLVSNDGENFTELVKNTKYEFNPATGNQVVMEFDRTSAKYVRAVLSANSGAVAGQIAEFEIYE